MPFQVPIVHPFIGQFTSRARPSPFSYWLNGPGSSYEYGSTFNSQYELEKLLKSVERGKKRLPIPLKCSGVPTGETPEDKRKVGERVLGPREN